MKTAISIPDEIFEAAEHAARKLGVSRSELYATAVREFVERNRRERITEKLDELYGESDPVSELDAGLSTLQVQSLPREEW